MRKFILSFFFVSVNKTFINYKIQIYCDFFIYFCGIKKTEVQIDLLFITYK